MRIEDCNTKEKLVAFLGQLGEDIDKDLFQQIVQKALGFGISNVLLAKEFQVTTGSIGRWSSGKTAPHPVGRPPVAKHLVTLLQAVPA